MPTLRNTPLFSSSYIDSPPHGTGLQKHGTPKKIWRTYKLILPALVCLGLGIFLIVKTPDTISSFQIGTSSESEILTVTLFVPRVPIAAGTLITSDNTQIIHWPKKEIPNGSVMKEVDVYGKKAAVPLRQGFPPIVFSDLRRR